MWHILLIYLENLIWGGNPAKHIEKRWHIPKVVSPQVSVGAGQQSPVNEAFARAGSHASARLQRPACHIAGRNLAQSIIVRFKHIYR